MFGLSKLSLYAIAAAVFLGLLSWGVISHNERMREQGRAEIRTEDAAALAKARESAQADHDKLTAKVTEAANENKTELESLRKYRDEHPLHGRLCLNAQNNRRPSSQASGQDTGASGSAPSTVDVQPVPERDPEPVGQSDTDIRGMLGDLAGRADQISTALRSCLAVTL